MPSPPLPPDAAPRERRPLPSLPWPARWRLRTDGPATAVGNMATDLALLDAAGARGTAILRTYRWTRPAVSFGRNERVRDVWDVSALTQAGFDVVRRPTGGRALCHAREVTYAVALPLPRAVPWRTAYDAVNTRLLAALHALGVPAELVADAAIGPPDGPACFAEPAAGEIVVAGRKLVGSAVWRSADAYLQHGSLLLHDDQHTLVHFRRDAGEPAPPAAALARWLGAPDAGGPGDVATPDGTDDTLRARVAAALHAAFAADATRVTEATRGAAEHAAEQAAERASREAHACRLADPAWLWRR